MAYRFNDKKKLTFFSQLQTLLKSGLGFSRSFSLIIDGAEGGDRTLLERLYNRVIAGESLWEALESEKSFSRLDSGVIRIGETTGRLHDALAFLTDYYAGKVEQKRMIVNALSYPMITLCIAAVVLVFMLMVVVPMFRQVYSRMGGELPALTEAMIRISEAMPSILAVVLALAVIVYACRKFLKDSEKYRRWSSLAILKLPIAGELVKKYQISRFCRLMHLMTGSGIPVLQALRMMSGIMTFHPFSESVRHVCETIEKGGNLADGIADDEYLYGKRFVVLIRVGEETSSLDHMFKTQAEDAASELEFGIRQMNSIIEPALILFIGVIVAFVLISMYLPMFKLGTTIQ